MPAHRALTEPRVHAGGDRSKEGRTERPRGKPPEAGPPERPAAEASNLFLETGATTVASTTVNTLSGGYGERRHSAARSIPYTGWEIWHPTRSEKKS